MRPLTQHLLLIGALLAPLVVPANSRAATLDQFVANDMTNSGEVAPAGVPSSWDWALRPRLNAGINANGYSALMPWGQIYSCASGNPQPDARIAFKSMRAFVLSKATKRWTQVTTTSIVEGAAYREDFVDDSSISADERLTSNGGSVRLAAGRNYHFWPAMNRVPIKASDVGGVTVLLSARLDPDTVAWGTPPPCYGVSLGADYWTSADASWSNLTTNRDVGIGRFKRVDTGWRLISMTTADAETLAASPLPTWTTVSELR